MKVGEPVACEQALLLGIGQREVEKVLFPREIGEPAYPCCLSFYIIFS